MHPVDRNTATKTTLYSWGRGGVTLCDALAVYGGRALRGICYTPRCCAIVVYGNDNLVAAHPAFDGEQVFEARLFDAQGELRWQRDLTANLGRAVYLTEDTNSPAALGQPATLEVYGNADQYLLWGRACGAVKGYNGWSWLSAAAHGQIAVPLELHDGGRAVFTYREYFGRAGKAGEDGNLAVLEERLTGIEAYDR